MVTNRQIYGYCDELGILELNTNTKEETTVDWSSLHKCAFG